MRRAACDSGTIEPYEHDRCFEIVNLGEPNGNDAKCAARKHPLDPAKCATPVTDVETCGRAFLYLYPDLATNANGNALNFFKTPYGPLRSNSYYHRDPLDDPGVAVATFRTWPYGCWVNQDLDRAPWDEGSEQNGNAFWWYDPHLEVCETGSVDDQFGVNILLPPALVRPSASDAPTTAWRKATRRRRPGTSARVRTGRSTAGAARCARCRAVVATACRRRRSRWRRLTATVPAVAD